MNRVRGIAIALVLASVALLTREAVAGVLRDGADFFSTNAESQVKQTLDRIQQRHGKNVVVETQTSPPPSVPTGGSEAARNQAYRDWLDRRGTEQGADVIILVTRNPSHVEVGSSKAMRDSGAFTANDHRATSDLILPRFRQKNFDEGILQAVQFIDRRLGQNTGPERNPAGTGAAAGSGTGTDASGGRSSPGYPPPPGQSNRAPAPQGSPGLVCGGGMGSLLCLAVVVIGAVVIFRRMMAGRAAQGAGYGQPGYGQPGYGPPHGGGYGQPGYGAGGGGFGRGVMGGVLGGLLGGWLMNRGAHGGGSALGGGDAGTGHPQGLPPTDPSTFGDSGGGGFTSSGGDFGGGGGGDFGGGSDSSSGGDF